MTTKKLAPPGVHTPAAPYSLAVETTGSVRWLHCAGQLGITPDGTLLDGFEAQAAQAWANLLAVLAHGGMGPHDIVKVTHFLIRPDYVPLYRSVLARFLGDARPASTMLIVQALARPEYLVEVEAVAAK